MIGDLIHQKEGPCFERKSIWVEPKALAVPLVAMANADGGTLLIGVTDGGEVEGVGLPEPEYRIESFMLHCTVRTMDVGGEEAQPTPQVTPQVTPPPKSRLESGLESRLESRLESLAVRILKLLCDTCHSKSEISDALGHTSISSKLNLRVNELLADGLVERTIPDKPASRLQKYRLTAKGRAMLIALEKE